MCLTSNFYTFNYPQHPFIPKNPYSNYILMYVGLASTIMGGDFAQGAAIGLVVTALNHDLYEGLDPDPTQKHKQKSELVLQYEKENGVELFGSIYEAADDWEIKYNEISIKEGREYGSNLFEVNPSCVKKNYFVKENIKFGV